MAGSARGGAASRGRGATRSAKAALRGLLATAVLLVLCLGIPLALVPLTSTSFPQGWPSPAQLGLDLTAPDDGRLLLSVLAVAAWIGWGTFALAVLLEIPAQVRGVPPLRLRGLGVQQSLASALVAAALAAVMFPAAASASDRRPLVDSAPPVGVVTRASAPRSLGAAPAKAVSDAAVPSTGETYTVHAGDTLWDIAAEHLGDGSLWRRIAQLNYDREQPGGARLDRSHQLRPGWRLLLPPDANVRHGSPVAHDRLVRPGDTLSSIAMDELGSAARYPEIVRASAAVVEPDGEHLTDANRIYPGWTVRVPASDPVPAVEPKHRPSAKARASRTTPSYLAGQPDPSWPAVPAPVTQSGHASVPVTGERSSGAAPADDHDDRAADAVDVRTVSGVGGLLAASLLLLVGARRVRQQRRRRPGQRIALPPPSVLATEARLRAVADAAGLAHVDLALRALAADHRTLGSPLPGLRYVRLTRTQLELYLAAPAQLPSPWISTSDPTIWTMTHEELTARPETDMRAPYPSLVTVGHDLEDAHVLVDLEQTAALAVEGGRAEAMPVLAGLAVELATSPWADDLLVTLVGCLPELPSAVATGRLRHVERIEQLVSDLEGRAADVERVLTEAGIDDLPAARGAGVADDAWPPEIVILAEDVPPSLRQRLETVLYRVPRVGVAAVTTGGQVLGEWRLALTSAGGTARLEPLRMTLRPQRLAGNDYEHLLELLATTDADPVTGPSWAAASPALEQALGDLPAPPLDHVDPGGRLDPSAPAGDPSGYDSQDESGSEGTTEPGDEHEIGPRADNSESEAGGAAPSAAVVRLPERAPIVRLLGPVEVVGALGPEPVTVKDGRAVANHLGRATALVAYLACRPEGATTDQLSEALSPVRRLSASTVWSLASRTRKWLGNDPDGLPYFPRTSDAGSNRLHPAIRTDWALWLELVGDDLSTAPLTKLIEALRLVRGRPFEGVAERHYSWAEPLRQDMIAGIVDVAHDVVRRALVVPDGPVARKAVAVGRLVDPTNELLWRDALRVEYVVGTRETRGRLVDQLYALADDLETDLEPETEALIVEVTSAGPVRAAVR